MNDMSKPVAVPAIGTEPRPDAELVRLLGEYKINRAAGRVEGEQPDTEESDKRHEHFTNAYWLAIEAMEVIPAISPLGLAAKAAVVREFPPEDGITPDELIASLADDCIRLGASPYPDNPDAELIRLCAEHATKMKAFNDDPRDADDCPFWPPYDHSLTAISEAKPQTFAGLAAKARAAKVEATNMYLDGREAPERTHGADWAWDLVGDLIRLAGGVACPIWAPSPTVPHPDAELIALCMSFIALEEAASSAPSSDDDTPLQREVMSKQSAMIDRIYEIRAQTVEGAVMRLRAAVAYWPELMRSGTGALSDVLMTAAIRDLTGEEVQ